MKIVAKTKNKKHKTEKKRVFKSKKEHVVIVAQEIKFARLLSGNEKKTRDRALKALKKWLLNCFVKGYEFKESDFTRIWKGLFYAVWMSDKPLVQEELCESIAGILDLFPVEQLRYALLMVKVGLKVLATEWYGIDQHRMDKCLMLVRRYLRGSLRCLLRCEWSLESCGMFADMLSEEDGILALKTPAYARNATSMILHILDCFLEELAKVSEGDLPADSVTELLRPVCAYLCGGETPGVCAAARRVLTQLLRQSELGLRYRDKTRAWQQMGCPEGGPDALELVSDDENEAGQGSDEEEADSSSGALDPRAGRVDVVLAPLPVPAAALAGALRAGLAAATPSAIKRARICLQRLEQLSNNWYPLLASPPPPARRAAPRAARRARALAALERQLVVDSDELALRGLSRKHRKRLLAASRAGQDIVGAARAGAPAPPAAGAPAPPGVGPPAPPRVAPGSGRRKRSGVGCANGNWQVEETEPEAKKKKNPPDTSNKENVIRSKKQNGDASNVKNEKVKDHKRKERKTNDDNVQNKQKNNNTNKTPAVIQGKNKKNAESSKTNAVTDKIHITKPVTEKDVKILENTANDATSVKKPKNAEEGDGKLKNGPKVLVNKVKNFQKQISPKSEKVLTTPKKVKFVLKNNSMQEPVDYYKSVRQSPNIPFDGKKKPPKANLKPSTPSPINPFFKKKLRLKK